MINNGLRSDTDSCDGLTNGRKMAPVLGVPPPPPPAPHMGPDGLILPRKPYNPYLSSTNHKDLRRELLFNQKVGKNVLNQKSELQRALEKQREAASRREAERNREENYKDDPRTALQRAIEQRAKHIEMTLEQSQPIEPPSNLLITARAKLRPRADSQWSYVKTKKERKIDLWNTINLISYGLAIIATLEPNFFLIIFSNLTTCTYTTFTPRRIH